MILKYIKLNNIRSYTSEQIEFPEGSVLLAGDIGSGKSSILQAVEFALFGSRRKHLSGASLLRHGKSEASVELSFSIDNKDVIIKRTLKRSKDDVKQHTGYVIQNDLKKEGTAIELKSWILELLGYPKETLTKSKDIIYRYTVYTPQEEMKQILFEEKETRLDTLRKVFNIDKYKRIRENTIIITRELKDKKKEYEGNIYDLDEKIKQKKEKQEEIKIIIEKIEKIEPEIKNIKEKLELKKTLLKETEEDIKELIQLKQEYALNEQNLKNILNQIQLKKQNLEKLDIQIELIKTKIQDQKIAEIENLEQQIKENETRLSYLEKEIKEIHKNLVEINYKKKHSEETKNKILKLSKCPTCEQDVSKEYKEKINEKETNAIDDYNSKLIKLKETEKESETKIKTIKERIDQLKKIEQQLKIIKVYKDNITEKQKEIENIIKQNEDLKKEVGKINTKKLELNTKIDLLKETELKYKTIKEEYEKILEEEKDIEIKKTALEKEKEGIEKITDSLEIEIKNKTEIKNKLTHLLQMQNWLDSFFVKLISSIEKQVMMSIYNEFNELFQKWFNMLIEDENLNVRLDDEFTPIIEQDEYETLLENLSGGEKTAVALAYRLALNRVINDIVSTINTKDIIMLDEPTDGFSTEQLDKIRDVLDELNMKQIIIVSHETKIESFVDNVVRVSKNEHVSQVS